MNERQEKGNLPFNQEVITAAPLVGHYIILYYMLRVYYSVVCIKYTNTWFCSPPRGLAGGGIKKNKTCLNTDNKCNDFVGQKEKNWFILRVPIKKNSYKGPVSCKQIAFLRCFRTDVDRGNIFFICSKYCRETVFFFLSFIVQF